MHRLPGRDDTVIRVGGDEFVVLLTGWNDEDTLESITTRLRSVLAPPYDAADQRLVVRASAGVIGPGSHDSVAELLRAADRAMYDDKEFPTASSR